MKGIDPATGREVRIRAENDLLAEALEHEIDHLNGILYIDYLESPDALVRIDAAPEAASEEAEARERQRQEAEA